MLGACTVEETKNSTTVPTIMASPIPADYPTASPTPPNTPGVYEEFPYSSADLRAQTNFAVLTHFQLTPQFEYCFQRHDTETRCNSLEEPISYESPQYLVVIINGAPRIVQYNYLSRRYLYSGSQRQEKLTYKFNSELIAATVKVAREAVVLEHFKLADQVVLDAGGGCSVVCQIGKFIMPGEQRFGHGSEAALVSYRYILDDKIGYKTSAIRGVCHEGDCPTDQGVVDSKQVLSIHCLTNQVCTLDTVSGTVTDASDSVLGNVAVTISRNGDLYGFDVAENEFTKLRHYGHSGVNINAETGAYSVQWWGVYGTGEIRQAEEYVVNKLALEDIQRAFIDGAQSMYTSNEI